MNSIVIADREKIKEICKKYKLCLVPQERTKFFAGFLCSLWQCIPKEKRYVFEVRAKMDKHNTHSLISRKKGSTTLKLPYRAEKPVCNGLTLFIRNNMLGLVRGIIDEPRTDISLDFPPPAPPLITSSQLTEEGIRIFWQDYKPFEGSYSGYKKASLFTTIYYSYNASILRKHFENAPEEVKFLPTYDSNGSEDYYHIRCKGKIISVQPVPADEVLDLNYLIGRNNTLIPLKYVMSATIRFQMDTILLIDGMVPEVSHLSNIEEVHWKNKESDEWYNQVIQKCKNFCATEDGILQGKPIVFKRFSKGIFEHGKGIYKTEDT